MQPILPNVIFLLVPVFVGGLLILAGMVFLWRAINIRRALEAAQTWTATSATITENDLRKKVQYNGTQAPYVRWTPVVSYSYTFLGQPYESQRVAFGVDRMRKRDAEAILARYPVGMAVTAYYNPEQPDEAVLERSSRGDKSYLVLGLVFELVGFGTACLGSGLTFLGWSGGI